MTTTPATTATESELAAQFPCNADPYAVWFNPYATPLYRWAVNDEDGDSIVDVRNYESAAKIAAAPEGRAQVSASVLCDIFTIHSQAVTSLAAVDGLPESELARIRRTFSRGVHAARYEGEAGKARCQRGCDAAQRDSQK